MLVLLYFSLLFFPSYQIDQSKAIIIFFSRAGENYNVGTVDVGNTEMIVNYLKHEYNFLQNKSRNRISNKLSTNGDSCSKRKIF